jgi:sugar lactone lactonase YvrE
MSIRVWSGLKSALVCAAVALLAGCGGGGGGGEPVPVPPDATMPLMVDGFGRQVPEADFGRGDPLAAGAEGIAFDSGPIANAQVTLTDNAGNIRTATTDASGYYRVDIKNLQLPLLVKVRRADGSEWLSEGIQSAVTRGFVPINVNGLTDKALGYLSEAVHAGGSAGDLTRLQLALNVALLEPAKARLRTGLGVMLARAGLDPASYDPVTLPLSLSPQHAAFLGGLTIAKNTKGRTSVAGILAGAPGPDRSTTGSTFQFWSGIVLDASGTAYVAADNAILKFSPSGVMSVLAGSGTSGFADGPAATAAFRSPQGLALDGAGNLFVTDAGNNAIRKISPAGMVTTVVRGDNGFADGQGAAAKFRWLNAIVVDAAGNLFVIDDLNEAVRKVTPDGTVTTIAGRTPAGDCCLGSDAVFYRTWLAIDQAGNLYSAPLVGKLVSLIDDRNRVIRKISPAGVHTDLYAPTGAAGAAFQPRAITVDATGTVYATDASTNRLHRISPDGTATTLGGGIAASEGIAVDRGGNVLVVDRLGARIRKVAPTGEVSTFAVGSGPIVDGPGAVARFDRPSAVAVEATGAILVADSGNDAIRRISPGGNVTTVAGGAGGGQADGPAALARFDTPSGIAVDSGGNAYVADTGNNAIRKITPAGVVSTLAGGAGPGFVDGAGAAARFDAPSDVAVDGDGNVYVADSGNASIRRITPAGVVSTVAGSGRVTGPEQLIAQGFGGVGKLAVAPDGTVVFSASCINVVYTRGRGCIRTIGANGVTTERSRPFTLYAPQAMAFDRQSNLYLLSGSRIQMLTPAGIETEVASAPGIDQAVDLAMDVNGNFVVADIGFSTSATARATPGPAIWLVLP